LKAHREDAKWKKEKFKETTGRRVTADFLLGS